MEEQNEKQAIEEMAERMIDIQRDFNEYCAKPCRDCEMGGIVNCENHYKAGRLYNAGYRKQEWISVDERLPDREGKYLVCTTNGNIGVGNFIDYYGKGTHLCFDCWAVTHWMPLPDPPKMKGGAE